MKWTLKSVNQTIYLLRVFETIQLSRTTDIEYNQMGTSTSKHDAGNLDLSIKAWTVLSAET